MNDDNLKKELQLLLQENKDLKSEVADLVVGLENFNCFVEYKLEEWDDLCFAHYMDKVEREDELKEEIKYIKKEYEAEINRLKEDYLDDLEERIEEKLEEYKDEIEEKIEAIDEKLDEIITSK